VNLNIRTCIGVFLAAILLVTCFSPGARMVLDLPEHKTLVVGESSAIKLSIPDQLKDKIQMQVAKPSRSVFATPYESPVLVNRNSSGYEIVALKPGKADVNLKLLGYIPLKSMAVEAIPPRRVVPGGHSIGVLLQSKGIMVVGFAPMISSDGAKMCPARDEGVEIGDVILSVNGRSINSENDLARVIDVNKDNSISLKIKRREDVINVPVKPYYCAETNRYRIGLYVRDGVVGVGTLTFWEPANKQFAALGHIIIDADTRQGIDVMQGRIVSASVQTVKPGKPGRPGEKIGIFNTDGAINGEIISNTSCGIFGHTDSDLKNPLYEYAMEVGYAHQVKTGSAKICTVINGEDIESFDILIEKVYPGRQGGKGMLLKVTDPGLLNTTGGIIQGMSGSPIIQDNRIIGAVTHVFLNDPQRGYGIFMDSLLSEMEVMDKAS
jgi:stage IV sporulation protein B